MTHPAEEPILLVAKLRANLTALADALARRGYATERAETLEALDRYLERGAVPALALIDISGFDSAIWARCSRLARHNRAPLLLIAPRESPALRRAGLSCGAGGILAKPVGIRDLLETIDMLAQRKPPSSGGQGLPNSSCPSRSDGERIVGSGD